MLSTKNRQVRSEITIGFRERRGQNYRGRFSTCPCLILARLECPSSPARGYLTISTLPSSFILTPTFGPILSLNRLMAG